MRRKHAGSVETPGNVGVPSAAALNVTGDGVTQSVAAYYGDSFTMKIIRGSLPPGLQLTLPDSRSTRCT